MILCLGAGVAHSVRENDILSLKLEAHAFGRSVSLV